MKLLLFVAAFAASFISLVTSDFDDFDDFDFCDDDNRFLYWWACPRGRWGRGGRWGGRGGGGGGGGVTVRGSLGIERRGRGDDAEGPENSEGGRFRGGSFGGSAGFAFGGAGRAGNFGQFSGNFFGGNNAGWGFQGGARIGSGGQFFNRNGLFNRGGGQFWRNGFFSPAGGNLWNRGGGSGFFNQRHNSFGGGWNQFQGVGNFGRRFNSGFNRWYYPHRPIYNFHRTFQNRNFIFPSQSHLHYIPRGHLGGGHGGGHFSSWNQNSGVFHLNNGRQWQRPWYNTGGFTGSRNFNAGFNSNFNHGNNFGMSNFFPYRNAGSTFSGNFRNFGRSRFSSSHGRFRYRHSPKVIMRPPQYHPGTWRRIGGDTGGGGHSRWTKKVPY